MGPFFALGMGMRPASRTSLLVLSFLPCACASLTGPSTDPVPSRDSIGELVFQVVRDGLKQGQECPDERSSAFADTHDAFVRDLDYVLTADAREDIGNYIRETLVPLIDSGKLPSFTSTIGQALRLMKAPGVDMEHQLPLAIAQFDPNGIGSHHMMSTVGAFLAEPDIDIVSHGGIRYLLAGSLGSRQIDRLVGFGYRTLARVSALPTCPKPPPRGDGVPGSGTALSEHSLLSQEGFVADPQHPTPIHAVRSNRNGWPLAQDGAQTDRDGAPMDRSNHRLVVPAFGWGSDHDADGLAVDGSGQPLYRYFDAGQTPLWHVARGLHRAVKDGAHLKLLSLMQGIFGQEVPCADGTAACTTFDPNHNDPAKMMFLAFEVLRDPHVQDVLSSFSSLARKDPTSVSSLLALGSNGLENMMATGFSPVSQDLLTFGDQALELIETFPPSPGQLPLMGQLLDVLHGVHATGVDIRGAISQALVYQTIVKNPTCSNAPPDPTSKPVDYSKPRFVNGADNRSLLEQGISALVAADCGSLPLTGQSVAMTLLSTAGTLPPSSVCSLVDTVTPLLGGGFGQSLSTQLLQAIGCSNPQQVLAALNTADQLAKTGGFDLVIPLATVFAQRNELPQLLSAIHQINDSLAQGDSGPQQSIIRRLLPTVAKLISDPKADSLFNLVDGLATTRLPGHTEPMSDSMAMAIAPMLDRGMVRTRDGQVTGKSMARVMLDTYGNIAARVRGTPAEQQMTALIEYVRGTALAQGSSGQLQDASVVPTIGGVTALDLVDPNLDPAQRTCAIDRAQHFVDDFLTSRDMPEVIHLLGTLTSSEAMGATAWLLRALAPDHSNDEGAPLAAAVQTLTHAIESENSDAALMAASRYGAALMAPGSVNIPFVIDMFDQLLYQDRANLVLPSLHRLLGAKHAPGGQPPLETFAQSFSAVSSRRSTSGCAPSDQALTPDQVQNTLDRITDFIDDPQHGLPKIYELIRDR